MNSLETIFRIVVELSWRGSCLVLIVFALRALLRGRLPASLIFAAWIVVAIRLLAPVVFPAPWSPFKFSLFERRPDPAIAGEAKPAPSRASPPGQASLTARTEPTLQPNAQFSLWTRTTLSQWIALGWAMGLAALLLARIVAYGRFIRALRRSPSLSAKVGGRAGFGRVKVQITDLVFTPALHGIFRPRLLFPPDFIEKLTPREMRLIVAHELAHHRRRDLLAQVFIRVATIVHWFNPLAWIMARVAREDCELACDEFVLGRLRDGAHQTYGATLLKIVALTNCGAPPPLALGVVESKLQIKRRIQMIVDQPSPTLGRTVLGCALFLLVTGLSLTRETRAQSPAAPAAVAANVPTPPTEEAISATAKITYNPATDGLDAVFANGIVASVGDKVITVQDVRREMKQFIPALEQAARDQGDFNVRFTRQQNQIVRLLVERALLVREFNQHKDTTGEKQIPSEYVDNAIADRIREQFDNDRAKFLNYLRTRGATLREYRREVEDDIIFHYMKSQERQLDSPWKPVKLGNQAHLRLIQLKRAEGETDAQLLDKAKPILARLKSGETFDALAREFSEDARRNRGGDWGWLRLEDVRAFYRDTVFAMKSGEVSVPIFAPEGCFILFVEDRR